MEGRDSVREEQRDELCSKSHSSVCIPKCSASVVCCTNFNTSVPNCLLLHSMEVKLFVFPQPPLTIFFKSELKTDSKKQCITHKLNAQYNLIKMRRCSDRYS